MTKDAWLWRQTPPTAEEPPPPPQVGDACCPRGWIKGGLAGVSEPPPLPITSPKGTVTQCLRAIFRASSSPDSNTRVSVKCTNLLYLESADDQQGAQKKKIWQMSCFTNKWSNIDWFLLGFWSLIHNVLIASFEYDDTCAVHLLLRLHALSRC